MPTRKPIDLRSGAGRRTRRAHRSHRAAAVLAACVAVFTAPPAAAAVFQYSVPVATTKNREARALLWIPAEVQRVRGVILCGTTLMERDFVRDERIRAVCRDESLAACILSCGIGQVDVQKVLDDLAKVSGYDELRLAPLFFAGHSAGGPPAQALAGKLASRCFGLLQYRGGMPSADSPIPPGIPALIMIGQFDEFSSAMRDEQGSESWERSVTRLAGFRALGADRLATLVVEPGAGHFAWSARNAKYAALFLRKAAAAIPREWKTEPDLRRPVPSSGWLTSLSPRDGATPAPFGEYTGDRAQTSWLFDEEMARATTTYHDGLLGRKDQFIKWQDRYWVDAGARFFFTKVQWVKGGPAFDVHPAFADVYPSRYNDRGPRWPHAGQPVGHCGGPIGIRPVGGPLIVDGSTRFRIRHDALAPAGGRVRATFLAFSAGDARYRYTEHAGMLPRGFKGLTKGAEQTITFPQPPDVTARSKPLALGASSDSGLPVEYYVAHGPAVVAGGKLVLQEIPVRTRYPIAIEVVAWQFGRAAEPFVKSAAPVARALRITAP